jgi:hypothetical protein
MDATTISQAYVEMRRREAEYGGLKRTRAPSAKPIPPRRHALLKKTHYGALNVDKAIDTLEVIAEEVFAKLVVENLQHDDVSEWLQRLRPCLRTMNAVIKRMGNVEKPSD